MEPKKKVNETQNGVAAPGRKRGADSGRKDKGKDGKGKNGKGKNGKGRGKGHGKGTVSKKKAKGAGKGIKKDKKALLQKAKTEKKGKAAKMKANVKEHVLQFFLNVISEKCLQKGRHAFGSGEEEVAFCHVLSAVSSLLLQVAVIFATYLILAFCSWFSLFL